jgi:hypothetical protein
MDDMVDNVIPSLMCDVELEFTGPNDATMHKWCADALRRLAVRIESNEFREDGEHDLFDNVGKKVGTVSLMYVGEPI